MNYLGWLGATLLSFCGFPQALQSYRTKSSKGISWSFLFLWGLGEILTFFYVFPKNNVLPLLMNYGFNIVFICVILYFKAKEIINER